MKFQKEKLAPGVVDLPRRRLSGARSAHSTAHADRGARTNGSTHLPARDVVGRRGVDDDGRRPRVARSRVRDRALESLGTLEVPDADAAVAAALDAGFNIRRVDDRVVGLSFDETSGPARPCQTA